MYSSVKFMWETFLDKKPLQLEIISHSANQNFSLNFSLREISIRL